jgi:hypothetical protein
LIQETNKIKTLAMKATIILAALFTGMILMNTESVNAQKSFDNNPLSIIQVITNQQKNEITIVWNDNSFDEVELHNQNGIYMPSIPLMNAKQIHLNDLKDGNYYVLFKSDNEVIATKEFKVGSNLDMAKSK